MSNNLQNIFTDIANAIRNKKSTSNTIKPVNMSNEILSISTGTDTSDATATSNDILLGKTAYANGGKIEGNIISYDGNYENGVEINSPTGTLNITENGIHNVSEYEKVDVNIISGNNLNIKYGLKPNDYNTNPLEDANSKVWIQTENKPSKVEVKEYLCDKINTMFKYAKVLFLKDDNLTYDDFKQGSSGLRSVYIGNNNIVIVGKGKVRIYNLYEKKFTRLYNIIWQGEIVGNNEYSNILYSKKDNCLYFGFIRTLFKYSLVDGIDDANRLEKLCGKTTSYFHIPYIFYDDEVNGNTNDYGIGFLMYYNSDSYYSSRCRYSLTTSTVNFAVKQFNKNDLDESGTYLLGRFFDRDTEQFIKYGDYIYNFKAGLTWKYNLKDNTFDLSQKDIISNFIKDYYNIADNISEELGLNSMSLLEYKDNIYIVGGYMGVLSSAPEYDKSTYYDNIFKYNPLTNTISFYGKMLSGRCQSFAHFIDSRLYVFGGSEYVSDNVEVYGRRKYIDYIDFEKYSDNYILKENDIIITSDQDIVKNSIKLINNDSLIFNSCISSAYVGNSNNIATKANIYYYNELINRIPDKFNKIIFNAPNILNNYLKLSDSFINDMIKLEISTEDNAMQDAGQFMAFITNDNAENYGLMMMSLFFGLISQSQNMVSSLLTKLMEKDSNLNEEKAMSLLSNIFRTPSTIKNYLTDEEIAGILKAELLNGKYSISDEDKEIINNLNGDIIAIYILTNYFENPIFGSCLCKQVNNQYAFPISLLNNFNGIPQETNTTFVWKSEESYILDFKNINHWLNSGMFESNISTLSYNVLSSVVFLNLNQIQSLNVLNFNVSEKEKDIVHWKGINCKDYQEE